MTEDKLNGLLKELDTSLPDLAPLCQDAEFLHSLLVIAIDHGELRGMAKTNQDWNKALSCYIYTSRRN